MVAEESLRERILGHAIKLFARKGFDATSLQDIADAAGVTKGALYYYYASKDDLLFRIHERVVSYETTHAEEILARGMDPDSTLQALIVDGVTSIGLFHEEVTVTLREMHRLQPEYFAKISAIREKYQTVFERVITQGQNQGLFRLDIPPRMATLALLGMSNWMFAWFKPEGSVTPTEIGQMFSLIFLQGMRLPALT